MNDRFTCSSFLTRLVLALAVWLVGAQAHALDGTLIVANRTGGSISFFDLSAGIEIARVPIGPRIPHEVDVSPDGRLALTAEYGPNSDRGRHVVIIDIASASIKGRIDLGPNSRPHTALFLPDGWRAVATMQDSDQLALLDIVEQRVLKLFPTGGREGHVVRLSPDGTRAYVSSRGAEGTLSVIYLDEDRPPDVIVTGPGAEGLDVTPDGREIWVANRDDESMSIVSADTLEIIETLPARPHAGRIDIGANGLAAMPNGRNNVEPSPQMVRIWNVAERSIVTEMPIRDGQPGLGNFGVLVHADTAFVADPGEGTVQMFAMDGSGKREVLASGHEGPDGIAWSPVRVNVMPAAAEPRFEFDPTWPKPLPERWINGQVGGVCVDSHDHIMIVDRRNITEEEAETNVPTPTLIMFDQEGNVIDSWGDPAVVPDGVHGCRFDAQDNVWIAGNRDAIVQKYSHSGELLLQIGTKGLFDTNDGTQEGRLRNRARDRLHRPAGAVVDDTTGEVFVADGYGNKRVIVFDAEGNYLRQWGRLATAEEVAAGTPGTFAEVVHCIELSNDDLVYVCDRQGDRVQVFDKSGEHIRDIHIPAERPNERGTAWWVAFSHDEAQRYLYVMNGGQERVHVIDRASGETLSTFGRPGHYPGNFTHGHTIATDSSGNIYVAETNFGRRVQRFRRVAEQQ
jgi:DNA-binding beta-propeller fold protein YncE